MHAIDHISIRRDFNYTSVVRSGLNKLRFQVVPTHVLLYIITL